MKGKKLLAVTLVLAMTAATMTGCGSSDSKTTEATETTETTETSVGTTEEAVVVEDVSLKVWGPEEYMDVLAEIQTSFAVAHPEFNVTWENAVVGVDESIGNLETDPELAADVFIYPSGSLGQLTLEGLAYPITVDYDYLVENNSEGAIKACSLDGLLYGVPSSPNCWFMYYDASKYTEEEVKNLDTMMAKDLGADVANFSCSISNSWYLEAFFYANGCTLFGADGLDPTDCTWNNEAGMEVGQYIIDLVANPKYVEDIDSIAGSLMLEGKLGALCSGTWASNDMKEALGDNYRAVKLPTITLGDKEVQLSNFADYKAWGVKSTTKYPLAAQTFAAYLGNEENQMKFYETDGTTPTITSLVENEAIAADLATSALISQAAVATPQPYIAKINDYWTPVEALGTAIVNKEITTANLQEKLDLCVENILADLTE